MQKSQHPDPLKKLVLFIIIIAILATIFALAWYLGVELPAQSALHSQPLNCFPCPCEGLSRCVGGCCRPPGGV